MIWDVRTNTADMGGNRVKQYTLLHTQPEALASGEIWTRAPKLEIGCYPWDETGYCPPASAQMVWAQDRLAVRYETVERAIRAEARGICPVVCDDSAVELFLMPEPAEGGRYLNFEINTLCAMYLGAGTCREDNVLQTQEDLPQFAARSELCLVPEGYRWRVTFEIPLAYLRRHAGCGELHAGKRMRANFYKIAEKGPCPHCGCWNPIVWEEPDFHRPEFFGDLCLG